MDIARLLPLMAYATRRNGALVQRKLECAAGTDAYDIGPA
jgi:hypothetical protein